MLKNRKYSFSKQIGKKSKTQFSRVVSDFPGKSIKHIKVSSRAIIQVADLARPKLLTAIIRTVKAVKDSIDVKELETQLVHQSMGGVLHVLNLKKRFADAAKGAGIDPSKDTFIGALQNTFHEGAKVAVVQLNKVPVIKSKAKGVGASMSFDMLNPKAVQHLQSYTFDLIDGISTQAQLAIQDALINAFQEGGPPADVAKEIISEIGLTQKQVLAVKNFKSMLKSGNPTEMRQALTRSLRDARSDTTVLQAIAGKVPLPKAQVDSMVNKYADRSLASRADAIARTETIRASNAGQQAAWKEAQDQGFLSNNARQQWIPNDDELLCDICDGIPDMNEDGVGLDEPFDSEIGEIDGPPAHVNCRCSVSLIEV